MILLLFAGGIHSRYAEYIFSFFLFLSLPDFQTSPITKSVELFFLLFLWNNRMQEIASLVIFFYVSDFLSAVTSLIQEGGEWSILCLFPCCRQFFSRQMCDFFVVFSYSCNNFFAHFCTTFCVNNSAFFPPHKTFLALAHQNNVAEESLLPHIATQKH